MFKVIELTIIVGEKDGFKCEGVSEEQVDRRRFPEIDGH
jgi:hypothetical protein